MDTTGMTPKILRIGADDRKKEGDRREKKNHPSPCVKRLKRLSTASTIKERKGGDRPCPCVREKGSTRVDDSTDEKRKKRHEPSGCSLIVVLRRTRAPRKKKKGMERRIQPLLTLGESADPDTVSPKRGGEEKKKNGCRKRAAGARPYLY